MKKIVAVTLLACNLCFATNEIKIYPQKHLSQRDFNQCIDMILDPETTDVERVVYFFGLKHMYYLNGDWERGEKICKFLDTLIRKNPECAEEYFRLWMSWD